MTDSEWLLPLAGLLVGIVLGAAARWNHFCTLSALERYWFANDSKGLRTWVLAIAVALSSTQFLQAFGIIDISQSFYLTARLQLLGALVGGLLFGVGMALVGTCSFGALVMLGGGSLRSLVVTVGIGLAAIATQRGLIAKFRVSYIEPTAIPLDTIGSQSIADIIGHWFNAPAPLPIALLLSAAMVFWVMSDANFRREFKSIFVATIIGLCVTLGWYISHTMKGVLFSPVQMESASFALPLGQIIQSIIAATSHVPDYGMGLAVGVICGAALIAWFNDDFRWEACDDARELSRHLTGAFFMGTGGVLAAGCTIGQGISAASTLALSAPIVFFSIYFGARMGLGLLLEGSAFGFLRSHN